MRTKKTVSMKAVVLLMAVVLLIGCTVGGSLAWLMTKTEAVTNTFVAGGIEIELTETLLDATNNPNGNEYQLIPGKTYAKDPKVTVKETTNVDCYLFVKVEENNAGNHLTYALNFDDWIPVETATSYRVYAREVKTTDSVKSWNLLKGKDGYTNGYVSVNDTLTLGDMSTADDSALKFTAYAIQMAGFEDNFLDAWTEAKKLDTSASGNN